MKQLVMSSPDERAALQRDALEEARWYRKQHLDRLRAISISQAGLEVKGSRRALAHVGGGGFDEGWLDGNAMELML